MAATPATTGYTHTQGHTTPPQSQNTLRSELLRAALAYASRGRPVFPCKPGGKEPLTYRGFHDATTDESRIHAWWNRWPLANIGIPTGERSGILALDVDHPPALEELEAERGQLPATRTHATGNGGIHYLFAYPSEAGESGAIRNSAGKLAPGLDVRGEGGYIVVPPSRTTRPYEVLDELPLAPVPEWLLGWLREPYKPRSRESRPPVLDRGRAAFVDSPGPVPLAAGGRIPEGQRNWTLYRRGCSLRARGHDQAAILEALERENLERCEPPLEAGEVERIAASAGRHALGTATGGPGPETLEALAEIEGELWRREWRGMGGKSERDAYAALIVAARRHSTRIPGGVRVSIDVRSWAVATAVSKRAMLDYRRNGKRKPGIITRLKMRGLIRSDNADRSGPEAGAFVIVSPRAQFHHSTTQSFADGRESASGETLRAPRLRWSTTHRERVGDTYETVVQLRLGKVAGAVIDALEAGPIPLDRLAAKIGYKRPRDLRRRQIARLMEAGVVECTGSEYRLTADWIDALNRERERAGEIAAMRRDMARYDRERDAYRNRHKVRPDPVPEKPPAGEIRELERLEDEELVPVELLQALKVFLRRNPHRRGEFPSWLATALWAEDLVLAKPPPELVARALDLLEVAA